MARYRYSARGIWPRLTYIKHRAAPRPPARGTMRGMTLLHTTMLMLTASCALMLIGFSARESRWGPALMMLGIVGALLLIAYNIYEMLPEH